MSEEQPIQAQQQPQPPPKSIDGVKPTPKLSGENQEHHLGEPKNQQQPLEQNLPTNNQPPKKTPKASTNNVPYIAITLAIIIGASLIALAVFVQISAK